MLGAARDGDADLERALLGIGRARRPARRGAAMRLISLEDALGPLAHLGERVDAVPERVAVAERPQHGAAHVLPDRQPRKDVGDLEAARQAAPVDLDRAGRPVTSSPLSRIVAGARREAAADQVEQRRLAGAVRADDRRAARRPGSSRLTPRMISVRPKLFSTAASAIAGALMAAPRGRARRASRRSRRSRRSGQVAAEQEDAADRQRAPRRARASGARQRRAGCRTGASCRCRRTRLTLRAVAHLDHQDRAERPSRAIGPSATR